MRLGCILILLLLVPVLLGAGAKKKGGDTHTDGANCSAGEIALGVDEDGAVQGCYVPTYTLLGSTHSDTVTDAVTRGSLIYGNATPKWDELVKGADGSVLFATALDIGWTNTPILDGTWTWGDGINLCFGDVGDACISYDTTNLLINPKHVAGDGYTDFTNAIMVSVDENKFSQFGAGAIGVSINNTKDRFLVTKTRTGTGATRRAGYFEMQVAMGASSSSAAKSFALNSWVVIDDDDSGDNTLVAVKGSAIGGIFGVDHGGAGEYGFVSGATSEVKITGAADGTIRLANAFIDLGGDGGAVSTGINLYRGYVTRDSENNVVHKIGYHIQEMDNASATNTGIRIDEVSDFALLLNSVSGTANDGISFGGCVDLFDEAATPQTTGVPDMLCDATRVELAADSQFYWSGVGELTSTAAIIHPKAPNTSTGGALEMNEVTIATAPASYVLLDVCDSATGAWATLIARDAELVSLAVTDAGDTINIAGLALAADEELDSSSAVFQSVTVVCMETNQWYATAFTGTWVEETP